MSKIFALTMNFLKGKIAAEEYKKELLKFSEIVDGNRSGNESLSFITAATEEIANLDSFEEDNGLRKQALVCDIFNNFAHSLLTSKTKNVSTDSLCGEMFALKRMAVFEIIRECERTRNKSYGLIEDQGKKNKIFVVDIPTCGQVKWHFPKATILHCKNYPFEIEDNGKNITNKNFILQEKRTSEIKMLSEHNQTVIGSLDVEEMNEQLGLNIQIIGNLEKQTKEPTLEELEEMDNKRNNSQNISYVQLNE